MKHPPRVIRIIVLLIIQINMITDCKYFFSFNKIKKSRYIRSIFTKYFTIGNIGVDDR